MDLKEFRSRNEISEITENLYISGRPDDITAAELAEMGVRLVISMTFIGPKSATIQPPVQLLHTPAIDFPLTPIPLGLLHRGVLASLAVMAEGHGVLVHCRWGRHRSVVMACCILIALGCTSDAAIDLVEAKRTTADPRAFYVVSRIKTFERHWLERWSCEDRVPAGIPAPACVVETERAEG